MLADFSARNFTDEAGNPAGGNVTGTGMAIFWQDGPLGRDGDRKEPNGAFVETVIAAAKQRLKFYQMVSNSKFACPENEAAMVALDTALKALDERTKAREARQVEGTHTA